MIRRNQIDPAIEHFAPEHRPARRDGAAEAHTWRRRRWFEIVLREKQIVRAGLHRHVHAARAPFGCFRDAAAGADVHDVKLRAGLSREIDGARNRVELGLDRTRCEKILRGSVRSYSRPAFASSPRSRRGRRPAGPGARLRASRPEASCHRRGETREGRIAHERLEADHAALGHRAPSDRPSRERSPPHSAKSAIDDASSAARFASTASAVTVHGVELSGMSKNSVPPPAASAWLPVSAPSHSVRPGSLKWRCASMSPGNTCRPVASIS